MTDRDVRHSLEAFVLQLRAGTTPKETSDLVAWRIQDHWKDAVTRQEPRPSHADLTGVLRTIIGSLDTRKPTRWTAIQQPKPQVSHSRI